MKWISPPLNVYMRVTSPVAELPEITYSTGVSIMTTDDDGLDHSIVVQVTDPHSMESSCSEGAWRTALLPWKNGWRGDHSRTC